MNFRKEISKPFRLKLFFLKRMPLGLLAKLRVDKINDKAAVVSLPFNSINKNPFKSLYFGAQAMAAELSTGILAMDAVMASGLNISMLVFQMEANFTKKAISRVMFECKQGEDIRAAVDKCIQTKEGVVVKVKTVGTDMTGDIVSEFFYTWTFKLKNK